MSKEYIVEGTVVLGEESITALQLKKLAEAEGIRKSSNSVVYANKRNGDTVAVSDQQLVPADAEDFTIAPAWIRGEG